jgi:hypothetical protein
MPLLIDTEDSPPVTTENLNVGLEDNTHTDNTDHPQAETCSTY